MTLPDTPHSSTRSTLAFAGSQVCVLWHAPGTSPAPELLGALGNKGLRVTLADNEHAAFAAACRCDGVAARTILVLDERSPLTGVDRVLSALARFAPGVICWAYREGANPPMVPLVHPTRRKQGAVAPSVPVRNTPPAPLRLVGEAAASPPPAPEASRAKRALAGQSGQSGHQGHQGHEVMARDVLDADELDALLAGEMGQRPRER